MYYSSSGVHGLDVLTTFLGSDILFNLFFFFFMFLVFGACAVYSI